MYYPLFQWVILAGLLLTHGNEVIAQAAAQPNNLGAFGREALFEIGVQLPSALYYAQKKADNILQSPDDTVQWLQTEAQSIIQDSPALIKEVGGSRISSAEQSQIRQFKNKALSIAATLFFITAKTLHQIEVATQKQAQSLVGKAKQKAQSAWQAIRSFVFDFPSNVKNTLNETSKTLKQVSTLGTAKVKDWLAKELTIYKQGIPLLLKYIKTKSLSAPEMATLKSFRNRILIVTIIIVIIVSYIAYQRYQAQQREPQSGVSYDEIRKAFNQEGIRPELPPRPQVAPPLPQRDYAPALPPRPDLAPPLPPRPQAAPPLPPRDYAPALPPRPELAPALPPRPQVAPPLPPRDYAPALPPRPSDPSASVSSSSQATERPLPPLPQGRPFAGAPRPTPQQKLLEDIEKGVALKKSAPRAIEQQSTPQLSTQDEIRQALVGALGSSGSTNVLQIEEESIDLPNDLAARLRSAREQARQKGPGARDSLIKTESQIYKEADERLRKKEAQEIEILRSQLQKSLENENKQEIQQLNNEIATLKKQFETTQNPRTKDRIRVLEEEIEDKQETSLDEQIEERIAEERLSLLEKIKNSRNY